MRKADLYSGESCVFCSWQGSRPRNVDKSRARSTVLSTKCDQSHTDTYKKNEKSKKDEERMPVWRKLLAGSVFDDHAVTAVHEAPHEPTAGMWREVFHVSRSMYFDTSGKMKRLNTLTE